MIGKALKATHRLWSRVLPAYYHAYKLPTGGSVYLDITESPMMLARVFGDFEAQKHRALDYFLCRGDGFIDIGANKGDFALHAALTVGERGKVVAFEPEPDNCRWIRKSIEASGITNIVLEEAAIGEKDGSLSLFLGEKSGWHSLVARGSNLHKKSLPVRVLQLDTYLENNPLQNLKAIKIDVEGFEKEVLLGASETLRHNDRLVVLMDIHPLHGVNHDEIFAILAGHGFSLFAEQHPFDLPLDTAAKPLEIVAVKPDRTTAEHRIPQSAMSATDSRMIGSTPPGRRSGR